MAKVVLKFDGKLLAVSLPDGTTVIMSDEREYSPRHGKNIGGYCVTVERNDFTVSIDHRLLEYNRIKAPIKQQIIKLKD